MQDGRVLVRSFRAAMIAIAVSMSCLVASAVKVGGVTLSGPYRPRLSAFVYVMELFTTYALVRWILESRDRLEKGFLYCWIGLVAISLLPRWSFPTAVLLCRSAAILFSLVALCLAIALTIDIGRPLYHQARLERLTKTKEGNSPSSNPQ